MTNVNYKDIYQKITDQIIDDLEKGTPPWIQPWRYEATESMHVQTGIWPRNAYSGNYYGGSNVLMCWAHMSVLGLNLKDTEPVFLTFRQAKMLGGYVKKSAKGCPVIAYRTGIKEVENADGDTETKTIRGVFGHVVFHVSQCKDITLKRGAWKEKPTILPDLSKEKDWQAFINATGAVVRHGGNKAVYYPLQDEIHMPKAGQFRSKELYKSVLCHELTHWTGHSKRLSRKLLNPKGDAQYAEEELVAELGAAFMCARLGIQHEKLRHASYIKSWLGVLKHDKKFIVKASSQAMRAVEFIENIASQELNKINTKETNKNAKTKPKVSRSKHRSDLRLHQ